MVVIVIIGVLAVAAAPSMRLSNYDRHTYNDAGAIMQLFRHAHGRALAYSIPVLVAMSANGAGDRGTFTTYIANNPVTNNVVVSCKTPFAWTPLPTGPTYTNANLTGVDFVNLNSGAGTVESDANIETILSYYDGSHAPFNTGYMCFTPLGRSFVTIASSSTAAQFDAMTANVFPLEAKVQRLSAAGSINRSVYVLPNGTARVFSHLW
jgi:type II secretory pathway pseudopilin PulG